MPQFKRLAAGFLPRGPAFDPSLSRRICDKQIDVGADFLPALSFTEGTP
jgi:hypothetical protein